MPEPYLVRYRGVFYIVFYEGNQRRRRSTGASDRAQAEAVFGEWKFHRARQARGDSIGAILDAYLDDRQTAIALRRLQTASVHIKAAFGNKLPAHFTKYDARDYKAARGKLVQPGTIRKELSVLKAALNWAEREKWIDRAPHVEMPPTVPPRERYLTHEEAERLIDASLGHVRLFVLLGLHTAARSQAILELRWANVDLEGKRIDFGVGWKIKKRAVVPINAILLPALETAKQAARSPFVIEWAGDRVRNIYKAFMRAAVKAKVEDAHPHDLRRTAATWMAGEGIDMRKIAKYLGHTNSATTEMVYAKFAPDYLEEAARALEKGWHKRASKSP